MKKVLKGYGIISVVIAAFEMAGCLLVFKYDLYEDYPNGPFDEWIGKGMGWLKTRSTGLKAFYAIVHFIITLIFWPITIPLSLVLSKKLN